jgi:hypothetical protein
MNNNELRYQWEGVSYAGQAAVLLLSFCVRDEEVIKAYGDREIIWSRSR